MKRLLVLSIALCALMAPFTVLAQKDYCKDIKIKKDEMRGIIQTSAPRVGPNKAYLEVVKTVDGDTKFTHLYIVFEYNFSDYRATGVYLKFEDGTIIKNENKRVDCSFISSYRFMYFGSLDLDEALIEKLSTKKVVKYRVSNIEKDLNDKDAVKLMAYVKCILPEH